MDRYEEFRELVARRVAEFQGPVFLTSVDPDQLWANYLPIGANIWGTF